MRIHALVLLFFCAAVVGVAAEERKAEKALTNNDVVVLAGAKLGDELVVAKIQQAPTEELDVSTDALIALKKAGVGNAIVDAMIKRVAARTAHAQESGAAQKTLESEPASAKVKACGMEASCPCVQNFTVEGSFMKGRIYKTSAPLGKLDRNATYDRVIQFIATDGWRLATSNKDSGIITATQDVNWSDGKTTPFSAVLKQTSDGLTIQLAFSTPAGTSSPKDAVVKDFCSIVDAAGGN
jgi:hypothetical protein